MINQKAVYKIKTPYPLISLLSSISMIIGTLSASAQQEIANDHTAEGRPMVRMAEIEIDPAYLEEYKVILAEEAVTSVKLEPGVIAIFPMYEAEKPTQVKILEIYASSSAYEQHLTTPHFQKYKTTTNNMVKSLKLVEMEAIDLATMPLIFRKLKEDQ
jgi:quinol monooxygenase YgiN